MVYKWFSEQLWSGVRCVTASISVAKQRMIINTFSFIFSFLVPFVHFLDILHHRALQILEGVKYIVANIYAFGNFVSYFQITMHVMYSFHRERDLQVGKLI